MAIFTKAQFTGNAIMPDGKLLEFQNNFYETVNQAEIDFLSAMPCYSLSETKPEAASVKREIPAGITGSISSNKLIK